MATTYDRGIEVLKQIKDRAGLLALTGMDTDEKEIINVIACTINHIKNAQKEDELMKIAEADLKSKLIAERDYAEAMAEKKANKASNTKEPPREVGAIKEELTKEEENEANAVIGRFLAFLCERGLNDSDS